MRQLKIFRTLIIILGIVNFSNALAGKRYQYITGAADEIKFCIGKDKQKPNNTFSLDDKIIASVNKNFTLVGNSGTGKHRRVLGIEARIDFQFKIDDGEYTDIDIDNWNKTNTFKVEKPIESTLTQRYNRYFAIFNEKQQEGDRKVVGTNFYDAIDITEPIQRKLNDIGTDWVTKTITFKFQIVVDLHCGEDKNAWNEDEEDKLNLIFPSSNNDPVNGGIPQPIYKTITIYNCSKINSEFRIADETFEKKYLYKDDNNNIYIYNDFESYKYPIKFTSFQSDEIKSILRSDSQSNFKITCSIWGQNDTLANDNFDNTVVIQHNNSGDTITFKREFKHSDFSCESDEINIIPLEKLNLNSLDDKTYYFFPNTNSTGIGNCKDIIKIEGERIKINTGTDYYGIQYGWQLDKNVYYSAEPDFEICTDNLSEGTHELYQFAYTKNFHADRTNNIDRDVLIQSGEDLGCIRINPDTIIKIKIKSYDAITREMFSMSRIKDICSDNGLNDTLVISFKGEKDALYGFSKKAVTLTVSCSDIFSQDKIFTIDKEITDTIIKIPFVKTFSDVPSEDVVINLEVKQHNYNFDYNTSFKVIESPKWNNEEFVISGGTIKKDDNTGIDTKLILTPGEFTFNINNRDNNCEYYLGYIDEEDLELIKLYGARVADIRDSKMYNAGNNRAEKAIKIIKISNGCESEPLYLSIEYTTQLLAGNIEIVNGLDNGELSYSCKGIVPTNKISSRSEATGGYGTDSYAYFWEYSTDKTTWNTIRNNDNNVIEGNSIDLSNWNRVMTDLVYIRRGVNSIGDSNNKVTAYSQPVTLKARISPVITLMMGDNEAQDTTVCYNAQLKLSYRIENESEFTKQGGKISSVQYEQYVEKNEQWEGINDRPKLTTSKTIRAIFTDNCGNKHSTAEFNIGVWNNPTSNFKYISDDCKVREKELNFSLEGAALLDNPQQFGYIFEDDTIYTKECTRKIPSSSDVRDFTFKIFITDVNGCYGTITQIIKNEDFSEPLKATQLLLTTERENIKFDESTNTYYICAGETVNIVDNSQINSTFGKDELTYSWYLVYNGEVKKSPLSYTSKNVTKFNTYLYDGYTGFKLIRRTSEMKSGTECQAVEDTINITYYSKINGGTIATDDNICYGENATSTITGVKGGSGNYEYIWGNHPYDDEEKDTPATESSSHTYKNITQSSNFFVTIKDNGCLSGENIIGDSEWYSYTHEEKINVNANLDFDLSTDPSFVTEEELTDNKKYTSLSIESVTPLQIGDTLFVNEDTIVYKTIADLNYPVEYKDFKDGIFAINVTRYTKDRKCSYQKTVYITLGSGFDGTPQIKSEPTSKESKDQIELCAGSEVTLSISSLPTYNKTKLDADDVTYQWFVENGSSYSPVGEIGDKTITVTTISNTTQTYFCKISYTPTNGDKAYSTSNKFSIKGKEKGSIGRASFQDGSQIYYVCKGSEGTVKLQANTKLATELQWQEYVNGTWKNIEENGATAHTTTNECIIDYSNYDKDMQFRLVAKDSCSGTEFISNFVEIKYQGQNHINPAHIYITDNLYFDALEEGIDSLSFGVKNETGIFYWTSDHTFQTTWEEGKNVTLNGPFGAGENTIYIYKVAADKGQCTSDTLEYKFKTYAKLQFEDIYTSNDDTLCTDNKKNILLYCYLLGGDGNYKVDWQILPKGKNSWISINFENKEITSPYFTLESDSTIFTPYNWNNIPYTNAIIGISSPQVSFKLRARITSGDGQKILTSEESINVYDEPLNGGKLLTYGAGLNRVLCYGSELGNVNASVASGGSGNPLYEWIYSEYDTLTSQYSQWKTMTNIANTQNFTYTYPVYNSCRIARKVSDKLCPNLTDTTEYLEIKVMEKEEITPEDITYTKSISSGSVGKMWGKTNRGSYNYIWYDINEDVLDTTEAGVAYITTPIMDEKTFFVRKEHTTTNCVSYNYDTIRITPYTVDGGTLSLADHKNSNSIVICSGEDVGRVLSSGRKNPSHNYRWFYKYKGQDEKIYELSSDGSYNINLDTLNVATIFRNDKESRFNNIKKIVQIFRRTDFEIETLKGTQRAEVYSDTIEVSIVPTFDVINALQFPNGTGYDLIGSLSSANKYNCKNAEIKVINTRSEEANEYLSGGDFGTWMYNKQQEPKFSSWWEVSLDNGLTFDSIEGSYSVNAIKPTYSKDAITQDMIFRIAVDAGCQTEYSPNYTLLISNEKAKESSFRYMAYTPESNYTNIIEDGFEIGDSLIITDVYAGNVSWYSDKDGKNILSSKKSLSTKITEDIATLYNQRKDELTGCLSDLVEVPINYYTNSDGGSIMSERGNNKICRGTQFRSIQNIRAAKGRRIYPADGKERIFKYKWQFAIELGTSKYTFIDIPGETGLSLSAEALNNALSTREAESFAVRRVAINESKRECYSDTIHLSYYDEFKGGSISSSNEKTNYCSDEELPIISSSSPTGGYCGEYNVFYLFTWEYSLNGEEYTDVYNGNYLNFAEKFTLNVNNLINNNVTIDPTKDNTLTIRAKYLDGDNGCQGTQYSNEINITIYKKSIKPSISQNNETCDSDMILVRADNPNQEYMFEWYMMIEDSVLWISEIADSMRIPRTPVNPEITGYAVAAQNIENRCVSEYTYFTVDSLPELHQEELNAPQNPYCYGSTVVINGSNVSGGNGSRSYEWQFSYDGISFDYHSNEADLLIKDLSQSAYYRRIVNDMCYTDTSNFIKISVLPKINFTSPEIISANDYKCEGQNFSVKVDETIFDSLVGRYTQFSEFNVMIENVDSFITLTSTNNRGVLSGYIGTEHSHQVKIAGKDTLGNVCESNTLTYLTHNAIPLLSENNNLSTTNLRPCNNDKITIIGESGIDENIKGEKIIYEWYVSNDQSTWEKIAMENSKDLTIEIIDTMYIKRMTTNGCDTIYTDVLTFRGKPVTQHDYINTLALEIVTTHSDSSNTVNLYARDHNVDANYYFDGDGNVQTLQYGQNTLPYPAETYADSSLSIKYSADQCYSKYKVNPLRGGRIDRDGEFFVCNNNGTTRLNSAGIAGGTGEYTYQWQYRNEYFEGNEFIDIVGETNYYIFIENKDVSVKTWYRLVTKSGEYVAYSNVISLERQKTPTVSAITPKEDSTFFAENELEVTAGKIIKYPTIPITITARVKNAERIVWKYSDDGENWFNLFPELNVTTDDSVSIVLNDSIEMRYYKVVAYNKCDVSSASPSMLVATKLDVSPILNSHITISHQNSCKGDELITICDVIKNDKKICTGDYFYVVSNITDDLTYQIDKKTYTGCDTIEWNSTDPIQIVIPNLVEETEIYIERISRITGSSFIKKVQAGGNSFNSGFEFSVLTQDKDKRYSSSEEKVEIEQGALVQFYVESNQPIKKIVWMLEENGSSYHLDETYESYLNKGKEYAVARIKEYILNQNRSYGGLYSTIENPHCYYYNAGEQRISMYIESESGCENFVTSKALYLPAEKVRNQSNKGNGFLEDEYIDVEEWISQQQEICIYPTITNDYITITYPQQEFEYAIIDESGKRLIYGSGENRIEVNISFLMQGNYLVKVNQSYFKIIKK